MSKKRSSNFELMRIISMAFVVLHHVIYHGDLISMTPNMISKMVLFIIELIVVVHVNSFILLTGYFQCKENFKLSKIFKLLLLVVFYWELIVLFFSAFHINQFSFSNLFDFFLMFDIKGYWFITYYLLLYCLSPFLNKLVHALSKKEYLTMLLLLVIIISVIPTFSSGLLSSYTGYSLAHFILLYLIGAYFRCYPLDMKKYKKRYFIFIMIVCVLFNYVFYYISYQTNGIYHMNIYLNYNNIFILVQSISYFLFFASLKFYNEFINMLSRMTFGIYLIHDNFFVRANYNKLLNLDVDLKYTNKYFLYIVMVSFSIFILAYIIESIRYILTEILFRNSKLRTVFNKIDKLLPYEK